MQKRQKRSSSGRQRTVGPFHGNRVIDVSKAAAQQLGFINQGTANVKVEQIIPGQTAAQTIISPNNKEFFVDLKSFGTQREAQAYLNQAAQSLPSDSKVMLENATTNTLSKWVRSAAKNVPPKQANAPVI